MRAGGAHGVLGQPLQLKPRLNHVSLHLHSALACGLVPVCVGPHVWQVCVWLRVCQRSGPSVHGLSSLSQPSASLPEPVLMSSRLVPSLWTRSLCLRTLSVPTAPHLASSLQQTERLVAEEMTEAPSPCLEEKSPRWAAEYRQEEKKTWLSDGFDIFECPTKTESSADVAGLGPPGEGSSWGGEEKG